MLRREQRGSQIHAPHVNRISHRFTRMDYGMKFQSVIYPAVICGLALLVPQRFDRIQRRSFARRVVAEEDSYRRREEN